MRLGSRFLRKHRREEVVASIGSQQATNNVDVCKEIDPASANLRSLVTTNGRGEGGGWW